MKPRNQHNKWLQWKLNHGLAVKGRAAGVPLRPNTKFAQLLGKFFIKGEPAIESSNGSETPGRRVFQQKVGGLVGPTGLCNGE